MTSPRSRPSPWLFLVLLLGLSGVGGCGDDGPGTYTTMKPHHGRDSGSDPDAGMGEGGNDGGGNAGNASAGNGGSDSAGMGGSDSAGEGGSDSAGSGGGGAGSGGGSGGAGGSGPCEPGSGALDLPDSPANPWIAFLENDGSELSQLYFVKADGTGLHGYAGTTLYETGPAWSPDGKKLAFAAVHESEGAQLHVLDFEAGSDDVLADIDLAVISRPRFTPDGDAIVFAGAESSTDKSTLYIADAVDGGATAITDPINGDGGHDVAPDGTVYFARLLANGITSDIYSIGATDDPSTDPTLVKAAAKVIGGVTVHPNGAYLMYAEDVGTDGPHTTQLVELDLECGTARNVGEEGDEEPAYFAGGDGLVLNRDSFGADTEIAVTDEDGVLVTRITDNDPVDSAPSVSSVESDDVDVTTF